MRRRTEIDGRRSPSPLAPLPPGEGKSASGGIAGVRGNQILRAMFGKPGLVALAVALSACSTFHTGAMPGEPKTATYAQIQDTRVRYVDVGKGPAVVLLHGFASALETWNLLIPTLAQKHRVIALDLKGFGWTDRPEGDYSPHAQAKLVLGLLDKLGVERAALVAHSWGSSVALTAAMHQPTRFTRIALYDAWVYEEQLPTMFVWARADGLGELLFDLFYKERPDDKLPQAYFDKSLITEKFMEEVENAMDRPGTVAAALAAVRGQRFAQIQDRYKTIQHPVLLLWGREDVVTTVPMGERLLRDLPHARMIVYPRCGHMPMIEAASASNRDLAAFVDEDLPRAELPRPDVPRAETPKTEGSQ
jgi:pimeloyl-ACP methyl ester carboxylesterase